jgi:hypothetical protein
MVLNFESQRVPVSAAFVVYSTTVTVLGSSVVIIIDPQ